MTRAIVLALGLLLGCSAATAYELPRSVESALEMEQADSLPGTSLYAAPIVLDGKRPGDLLRKEEMTGYTLPVQKSVRLVYVSLDLQGNPVPASGVVLIPHGPTPKGGWPLIVWAHGTSGVAPQCAPSLMKDVLYGDIGLRSLLLAGFAVLAPDYAGLGTDSPHLWGVKNLQAYDVIYSVPAARMAVPELGWRWVVDGHSQGGLAAWGVAELESALTDDSYMGAVSVSGAIDMVNFMDRIGQHPEGFMYLEYIAWTLQHLNPDFRPSQILSEPLARHYAQVTHDGCWYYAYALLRDIPAGHALQPRWRDDPSVQRFRAMNSLGDIRIRKPLLVVTGGADQTIPITTARQIVAKACKVGSLIEFKQYDRLGHDPTMIESLPMQITWIRERLSSKPARSDCST